MRFGLLGTLAVWADNGRLAEVPEAKVRALLADLLIHLGQPVPADRLIDDLWGDDLPVHPAGALQVKVSRKFCDAQVVGSESNDHVRGNRVLMQIVIVPDDARKRECFLSHR